MLGGGQLRTSGRGFSNEVNQLRAVIALQSEAVGEKTVREGDKTLKTE